MIKTLNKEPEIKNDFLIDVIEGLGSEIKKISSKYFYDSNGDSIFQKIMAMEEYYLTNAEHEIFSTYKNQLAQLFSEGDNHFNLIEFGAGDCYKTKVLLHEFQSQGLSFDFIPVDISQNVIESLGDTLELEMPTLSFKGIQGDYFDVLDQLSTSSRNRNVVLFLGSNIGNFTTQEAEHFLSSIQKKLNPNDLLVIGVDIKKNPEKILLAYNDPNQITASFNLNLLHRINKELGANFNLNNFKHYPSYDAVTGECKSAILSTTEQKVSIGDHTFHFEKWEPIHTEISKKYSLKEIKKLASTAGFEIKKNLQDRNEYFVDTIWKVI